jgi:hypothetical protein
MISKIFKDAEANARSTPQEAIRLLSLRGLQKP